VRLGPGSQNIIAFGGKTLEYLDYVFRGFSGAEDDLRETPPDLTMVVNARKSQVLERQMPKLLDRLLDPDLVVLDLL